MLPDGYPKTWSDMSFEYRSMFVYHIVMMVMFAAGRDLAFIEQIFIAAAIALAVAIASYIRRRSKKWHWQGVTKLRAAGIVLVIALLGFFLFVGTAGALQAPEVSLGRPFPMGPWALAVLGIAVFSVLNVARVTHLSEKAFLEECGDQALLPKPAPPSEPRWKVIVKYGFAAAFLCVWLEAATAFYVFGTTYRSGSQVPTIEQTEPLTNHGRTVYVTPAAKHLVDQLQGFMFIGIPAALATAFFLQYVLKIRLSVLR